LSLSEKFDLKGPIKKIGVVGMGYVGIPAAVLFADSNEFNFVYGFQRTSETSGYKIEMLNHGESPLKGKEPELDGLLRKVVDLKKFECTSDFSKISELDAVTIAIQTPFKNPKDLTPDFGALIDGIGKVGVNLTEGMIIVVESTVTPGSTEGLVREILEKNSGLKAGKILALPMRLSVLW
jgi:UDP-N-acetyl-D-mannosaminuronic acid dehydrogenase